MVNWWMSADMSKRCLKFVSPKPVLPGPFRVSLPLSHGGSFPEKCSYEFLVWSNSCPQMVLHFEFWFAFNQFHARGSRLLSFTFAVCISCYGRLRLNFASVSCAWSSLRPWLVFDMVCIWDLIYRLCFMFYIAFMVWDWIILRPSFYQSINHSSVLNFASLVRVLYCAHPLGLIDFAFIVLEFAVWDFLLMFGVYDEL